MGKRNRDRNRDRTRERNRERRREEGRRGAGAGLGAAIRELLFDTATALGMQLESRAHELLAVLDAGPPVAGGRQLVSVELQAVMAEAIERAWERGWQPVDLHRLAEARCSSGHAGFLVDVIAGDASRYSEAALDPRWISQLRALGARVWWNPKEPHLDQWVAREGVSRVKALRYALEFLALLRILPAQPRLCDPPGRRRPGSARRPASRGRAGAGDSRMLERVRALLAKAESTTFEAEAEALTAKAQELMARHAIDEAMLDAGEGVSYEAEGVRIWIDSPYANAKACLLAVVAEANGCKAVQTKLLGMVMVTVIGFPAELESVDVLYTSLLMQATSAMVSAGSRADARGRSRTRSFRHSFLLAYAGRIGERLYEATRSSHDAATQHYGGSLLPVLVERSAKVEEAFNAAFPRTGAVRSAATNSEGFHAGRTAADLAWLSTRREVPADVA